MMLAVGIDRAMRRRVLIRAFVGTALVALFGSGAVLAWQPPGGPGGGPPGRTHSITQSSGDLKLVPARQQPPANGRATIRVEGDLRIIEANSLPSHAVGAFPNPGNPNRIQADAKTYRVPAQPVQAAAATPAGPYVFGVGVNGVPFDPGAAEFYSDEASSRGGRGGPPQGRRGGQGGPPPGMRGRGPGRFGPPRGGFGPPGGPRGGGFGPPGEGPPNGGPGGQNGGPAGPGGDGRWQYEALSGAVALGLDENHAHVQPTGAYHYHGIPTGLVESLQKEGGQTHQHADGSEHAHGDASAHSPLVGWAADGFPIYSVFGFADAASGEGEVVALTSSYRLKEGTRPDGPGEPGGRYDGTFTADYEYVRGAGDLDECNGRVCVTPEFPDSTYAYFLTEEFPVVPRLLRGRPSDDFARGGGSPGRRSRR